MMEAPSEDPEVRHGADTGDPADAPNAAEVGWYLVSRDEWGALPSKAELAPLQLPVTNVIIAYNTGVEPCNSPDECALRMRQIQQMHMDKGMPDMHYNFLIGSDENVYEGRGWNHQPEPFKANPDYDGTSICIGVIGDANDTNDVRVPHLYTAVYMANHGVDEGHVQEEYFVGEDDQKFE